MFLLCYTCSNSSDDTQRETDKVLPTIACPGDITEDVDAFSNGTIITYQTPVGMDNLEGAVTRQTAGHPSGNTLPIGVTTNTFLVTDAAENKASCSFNVAVTKAEPSSNLRYFIDSNPTPSGKNV